jgi:spore coat polysaccharide biosynthesis predicted glycosyltransferase SpsG
MRLPSIVIPVTEIQTTVAKLLSEKGITHTLVFRGKDIIREIADTLNMIINSGSIREAMSIACKGFLDANGVSRVVDKIFIF